MIIGLPLQATLLYTYLWENAPKYLGGQGHNKNKPFEVRLGSTIKYSKNTNGAKAPPWEQTKHVEVHSKSNISKVVLACFNFGGLFGDLTHGRCGP